jgi:hypothetical protein
MTEFYAFSHGNENFTQKKTLFPFFFLAHGKNYLFKQ